MKGHANKQMLLQAPTLQSIMIIVGIGVALFIGWAVLPHRNPAPSVNGRTLLEWLQDLDALDQTRRAAAEQAIVLLGEKSVPFLREILLRRDPLFLSVYRKLQTRFPFWLGRQLHMSLKPEEFDSQRKQAAQAFQLLGPKAASAVPDLINALDDRSPIVRLAASEALSKIGKDALPALAQALKTRSRFARVQILMIIAKHGCDAHVALPAVFDLISRCNTDVEMTAACHFLRQFDLESLEPLFQMLGSEDREVRSRAMEAFREVVLARPAGPSGVIRLYTDRPFPVRAAMVDVIETATFAPWFKEIFMTAVALDPDPRLNLRGLQWLQVNVAPDRRKRLLRLFPEESRTQLPNGLSSPGAHFNEDDTSHLSCRRVSPAQGLTPQSHSGF